MTKKPYYKLVIGVKPYTLADMRFSCGRVRVELSDALKGQIKLGDLIDIRWGSALRKVLAFWSDQPAGVAVVLTEPGDRPLAAEVAALDAHRSSP